MSVGIQVPIFAPETSVTARMDLVYQWMMWLLSVRTDMASYSNKHLHLVLDIPVSVGAWMLVFMTTQAATVSCIGPTSLIILVWLNVVAHRKYLYLQEGLTSAVEGIVQCVNWRLQNNYDHMKTSLSTHGVLNQCTIIVANPNNTSSRCVKCKGLHIDRQCGPLLVTTAEVSSTVMRWWRSSRS